jgi:hypothetical protein
MTLELVEVSLLQTDLEVDYMAFWCGANSGPFPGNWVRFFDGVWRTNSERRCTCKHGKKSCKPN